MNVALLFTVPFLTLAVYLFQTNSIDKGIARITQLDDPVTLPVQQSIDLCWHRPLHVEYIWNELNKEAVACEFITVGSGDGAKNLCEVPLDTDTVISLGSANDWSFEMEVHKWTNRIHTFDCTSDDRGKPAFVTFHKQCIGKQYGYSYEKMCDELQVCDNAVLKMDIEYGEWDVITELCRSSKKPKMMMIELHMSPAMNCGDFVMAQQWRQTLSDGGYELANWRRNPSCRHCVETTYIRKAQVEKQLNEKCLLRFHVMNEGLGGTLSQVLLGMVLAKEREMDFCLSNPLIDPQLEHMNQYEWAHRYLQFNQCREFVRATCDVDVNWEDHYWTRPAVMTKHRQLYPGWMDAAKQALHESPLNSKFDYCVHVRTGDLVSVPVVDWNGRIIQVFGWDGRQDLEFCRRNECKMIKDKGVEFDFVNLATCTHRIVSDSSFAVVAGILGGATDKPNGRGRTREFYY